MRFVTALVAAALLVPTSLEGQEITVYLNSTATDTIPIRPGSVYTLVARNAIPGKEYTLRAVPKHASIPEIPSVDLTSDTAECRVDAFEARLRAARSEMTVAAIVDSLRALREVEACMGAGRDKADSLIKATRVEWRIGPFPESTIVILTIRRAGWRTKATAR